MATKSEIVESAFRLGTGRYIQEDGAAGRLGEELALLGCNHPYIIHGKTALSVAGEKIAKSLSDAGMEPSITNTPPSVTPPGRLKSSKAKPLPPVTRW